MISQDTSVLRLAQTQQQSVSTQPVTAHQNSTVLMDCAPVPRQPTWVSNQDPKISIMTSQMIQFNCSWLFNSIVAATCMSVYVFFYFTACKTQQDCLDIANWDCPANRRHCIDNTCRCTRF